MHASCAINETPPNLQQSRKIAPEKPRSYMPIWDRMFLRTGSDSNPQYAIDIDAVSRSAQSSPLRLTMTNAIQFCDRAENLKAKKRQALLPALNGVRYSRLFSPQRVQ